MITNYLPKILVRVSLFLWLFSTVGFGAYGQSGRDNIESLKIAFLTKKMNLSPDEAKPFWPVYNLYQNELNSLRDNRKKARKVAKDDLNLMSEVEVEKLVDDEISFKQGELDIQKKYHQQFKKVLSIKKVAQLYRAEEEFKKYLIEKLQESKGK